MLVVALHFYKFYVVRILEENPYACAAAEECIAQNFNETWQNSQSMILLVF